MDKFNHLESMPWSSPRRATFGPRRIFRFCVLGILLPVICLVVPLYMRFQALRPHLLMFSPSDMKLLNQESRVSTVWCQGLDIRMNASFNAYLLPERPRLERFRKHVTMHRKMILEDDIKEYWGFYLIRGSIAGLSVCARYEGASFILLKGLKDARRCSFLGELDASEEESAETSEELDFQRVTPAVLAADDGRQERTSKEDHIQELSSLTKQQLLQRYLEMMKDAGNISENITEVLSNIYKTQKTQKGVQLQRTYEGLSDDEVENAAVEDLDDLVDENHEPKNQGQFIQRNKNETERSHEDTFSSFSSSEEALMRCEGLIYNLVLGGSIKCNVNATAEELRNISQAITYEIPETGFYYFIFANENEIKDNFLSASFDLHKTVFDVSSNSQNCANTTHCSLPLGFWSHEHVVLEVPDDKVDPCDALLGYSSLEECHRVIIAESMCKPRKSIYTACLLLVPVLVLMFAYI